MNITNALTIDVEDFFHVSAFSSVIAQKEWKNFQYRVENNTDVLLELLELHNVKATFFVLGCVAEDLPHLSQKIHAHGHEVACHGYSHQLVNQQTSNTFKDETLKAKNILESQIGSRIYGYRAASFSLSEALTPWAFEVLHEAEFQYDSSIYPNRGSLFNDQSKNIIHSHSIDANRQITEIPIPSASIAGLPLPVCGGGYFRLFPYRLTKKGLKQINHQFEQPFIFYIHPWEIDLGQPRIRQASYLSKFRHYCNIGRCLSRLDQLLNDFSFTTCLQLINDPPPQ